MREWNQHLSSLLEENPDIIINVIDASCLKRSLYLTFQLLEIGKPVIIALNMMDIAKRRGLEIDIDTLSNELGVPVIATNGVRGILFIDCYTRIICNMLINAT